MLYFHENYILVPSFITATWWKVAIVGHEHLRHQKARLWISNPFRTLSACHLKNAKAQRKGNNTSEDYITACTFEGGVNVMPACSKDVSSVYGNWAKLKETGFVIDFFFKLKWYYTPLPIKSLNSFYKYRSKCVKYTKIALSRLKFQCYVEVYSKDGIRFPYWEPIKVKSM